MQLLFLILTGNQNSSYYVNHILFETVQVSTVSYDLLLCWLVTDLYNEHRLLHFCERKLAILDTADQ